MRPVPVPPSAILSADSVQIYDELTFGANKPGPEELEAAPQLFVRGQPLNSSREDDGSSTAMKWIEGASAALDDQTGPGVHPKVFCGGSSMYVDWLLNGPPSSPGFANGTVPEGSAIESRASRVNMEYQSAANTHDGLHGTQEATFLLENYGHVRWLVVGLRGELSKDFCNLIIKASTAAATKNWAKLGDESSTLAKAKYLRVLGKKIILAAVREQAAWMSGRFEQARMQKAGGSGPSRRARAQERRSRKAKRYYFDTHAGFAPADWRISRPLAQFHLRKRFTCTIL